jgi:hypothetical protein
MSFEGCLPQPPWYLHYAVVTRPYVCTPMSILGRSHQAHPTEAHLQSLRKVLRYRHGTLNLHMTLKGAVATILLVAGVMRDPFSAGWTATS